MLNLKEDFVIEVLFLYASKIYLASFYFCILKNLLHLLRSVVSSPRFNFSPSMSNVSLWRYKISPHRCNVAPLRSIISPPKTNFSPKRSNDSPKRYIISPRSTNVSPSRCNLYLRLKDYVFRYCNRNRILTVRNYTLHSIVTWT